MLATVPGTEEMTTITGVVAAAAAIVAVVRVPHLSSI